jgi:hypothetical protein
MATEAGDKMSDNAPFQVDEIVIMHSPFTEEDVLVNYRGRNGAKAVVIPTPKGLQMSVPVEWLRKQEEKK